MAKAGAAKKYRALCRGEAMAQGLRKVNWAYAGVTLTFHPPHRRGDDDNAVAAFKSGRDGVADALGVDDRNWRCIYQWGEVYKGGIVLMQVGKHDGSLVPYRP